MSLDLYKFTINIQKTTDMKNERLFIFLFVLLAITTSNAQKKKLENPFETKGDLNSQFIYLEKTSTNYKEYKVITKAKFEKLHKNVMDSMSVQHNLLLEQKKQNTNQKKTINNLNTEVSNLNNKLNNANTNKNSITAFGITLDKSNYNLTAGIIILALLTSTLLFFYKFTNSNVVTKDAKRQLEETQNEYDAYQKSSLRRQQEISRKLQDEIIKNRKD